MSPIMDVVDLVTIYRGRHGTIDSIGHVRGGRGGRAFGGKFFLQDFISPSPSVAGSKGMFSIYNINYSKTTTSTTDRANVYGGQTMSVVKTYRGHHVQTRPTLSG